MVINSTPLFSLGTHYALGHFLEGTQCLLGIMGNCTKMEKKVVPVGNDHSGIFINLSLFFFFTPEITEYPWSSNVAECSLW